MLSEELELLPHGIYAALEVAPSEEWEEYLDSLTCLGQPVPIDSLHVSVQYPIEFCEAGVRMSLEELEPVEECLAARLALMFVEGMMLKPHGGNLRGCNKYAALSLQESIELNDVRSTIEDIARTTLGAELEPRRSGFHMGILDLEASLPLSQIKLVDTRPPDGLVIAGFCTAIVPILSACTEDSVS